MTEKKKRPSGEFGKEKNAFADGSSKKGNDSQKAKRKQPGTHQPRDANVTSGHDVQKQGKPTSENNIQKQKQSKTSGHNVQKQKQSKTSGHDVQKQKQSKTSGRDVQKPEQDRFFGNKDSFGNFAGKTQGQKAKPGQKKRRQRKQFQKENNFTENKEESESGNAGGKTQNRFSKEQNAFTENDGEEQGGGAGAGDSKEDYRRRDTYHRNEKKGRYHRREHQDRERTKKSDFERDFQTKDATFAKDDAFTDGTEPEVQGSKKLNKLQGKAEKAAERTQKARKKLPKKKEYSLERVFDEKTGRARYVLTAEIKEKPFQAENPVKRMAGRTGSEFANYAHGKVAEAEKDNSAVEGAHKTEQKAEDGYRFIRRHYKGKEQRRRAKVAKLEKKQFQKEVNFRCQKFLEENPEMQEKTLKKQLQKRLQKQRIKREYAKAKRAGQAAKNTKEAAVKSANITTTVAKKLQEMAAKHASALVAAGAFAVLLIMIMTSISSCGAMFSEGMSITLAGSYMSVPAEIDAADLAFSALEMELQKEIDSIETDYPDYDEYRYNLDAIGHDPFALISYLSAVHTEFTAADVQGEIESLFDEMYELTLNPTEETRTRTVTKTGTRTITDPVTGEETEEEYEYEEEEEYTVTILEVTLTAKDLNIVVAGRMNSEQKDIYALYNETHGLTQQFYTPLNLYWYNYVSSYYGYRINPVTGAEQFHRGVDIAVQTGTEVLAAMDGTVTTAAYDSHYGNYIVIEDDKGYCTKYAHMDTLSVSAGQSVKHGDTIGTTGNTGSSTGSHLHIECLYNGEYYNPLFYFEAGEGTLYGENNVPGSGGGNTIPPDSYDDAAVQALMEEAAKYLGYPYVWGGSSPSTSFDCSGFVCWVFTNSGVHNLPRTTAQGIYDQCTPVSAADAKAGDIIFFTGTYNSAGPVSHVGIYCGNGVMIHCGDPIKYASINTSYWQSHFYAFGRISGN
jgi:murein DD-endopeptidase MepM/ murein hydrolase activator NlpD